MNTEVFINFTTEEKNLLTRNIKEFQIKKFQRQILLEFNKIILYLYIFIE